MSGSDDPVAQAIHLETSHFLARGGRYAAGLGSAAILTLGGGWLLGDDFFALPAVITVVATLWALLLAEAAKRGLLRGGMRVAVMFPLVSLPTLRLVDREGPPRSDRSVGQ